MPRSRSRFFDPDRLPERELSADWMDLDITEDDNDPEMLENAIENVDVGHDLQTDEDDAIMDSDDDNDVNLDGPNNVDHSVSEMKKMLQNISTPALLHVACACVSRASNTAFKRSLLPLEDSIAHEANSLWMYNKNEFSTHFYCNKCGLAARISKKCEYCSDGNVATYVRVGAFNQILDLVETYLSEILKIRSDLKKGEATKHNLNCPFFSRFWKLDTLNHLHLSLVVSIDGVCVPGNKKKLWPISFVLVDLPTGLMQKSTNVVLAGVVECLENPSTNLWNAIIPFILTDVESHVGQVKGTKFTCHITTCSADQPAKRSFFGLRAHQSAQSCMYCLSQGTWYKRGGRRRRDERPGQATLQDSRLSRHGFGSVPSRIISHILPYETPIDVLHGLGEGLYQSIRKELLPVDCKTTVFRSDLFSNNNRDLKEAFTRVILHSSLKNIADCRNGTDKTNFFRIIVTLVAPTCEVLSAKARTIIVALGMIGNKMFTNSDGSCLFDEQMTASARWFLSEANVEGEYLSMKNHEILFHLREINELFGNTGPLSTFSFESFYQFALCGYSSRTTRSFVKNASTKVLLHMSIRREIAKRTLNNPTPRLLKFVAITPDIVPIKPSWQNKIETLLPIDEINSVSGCVCYSRLNTVYGSLKSEYYSTNTHDDMIFAKLGNGKSCFRFAMAMIKDDFVQILAEPVTALEPEDQFASFGKVKEVLTSNDHYYASEVHRLLKSYDGIQCGRLSGERIVIPLDALEGVACYIHADNSTVFLQVNGAFLHN